MCHFLSWIVKGKEVYFLTASDIESKRGRELREYCQNDSDLKGHGAIRHFYSLTGGKDFERKDFSTPKGFPAQIISAIKNGKFQHWFGPVPQGILRAPLYADYKAKCDALDADYEYEAKCDALDADYKAKRDALYADYEYEAKCDALYADYKAKRAPLDADYKAKRDALYADYEAKRAPLDADYKAKRAPLDADAWMLVTKTKNRSEAWK